MMMHHPVEDDDIREIKVFQTRQRPMMKAPNLASPTTPFQFETNSASRYYSQESPSAAQFDEATSKIQRTIQLQLLNYIQNFGGISQHAFHHPATTTNNLETFPQPVEQQQQQQQQHSSIALLQQRFQRLERDKEMRQAKQRSSSLESSFLDDRRSPFQTQSSTWPPTFSNSKEVMFPKEFLGKNVPFLAPESIPSFGVSQESSSLHHAYYDNRAPRETQFLLKNWTEKSNVCSLPQDTDDSDELDTTLHL